MIVRTYGRRSRGGISGTFSDPLDDDVLDPYNDSFSSQETGHDLYAFSSQESTHFDSEQAYGDYPNSGVPKKAKKQRRSEATGSRAELGVGNFPVLRTTSTLMETQEFGEMMEHVDEVNFALDGLRKGQPVRIRRASLLSLLGICATAQQRRLLRTNGMVKTIIDSVVGLSFDDTPSNLAAAALFYVLISDGQDEQLMGSPSCIRFLIKLLKPVISRATEDTLPRIGSKLLRLRKDAETLHGTGSKLDSTSANITSRVKEILGSCKELKSTFADECKMRRPELSPKWIALLSMEKASFSTIALEETSGIIRKTGGNFKEKLREFGGLDAVFEVVMHCHSIMEDWRDAGPSSVSNAKDDTHLESLVLLLKCLKIMENATFLSQDNQNYLLQMRGNLDSQGSRLSFTKLVLSAVKILSGLFLDKGSSAASQGDKSKSSTGTSHTTEFVLLSDDRDEAFSIKTFKEHCSVEEPSSQRTDTPMDYHCLSTSSLRHSIPSSEVRTSSMNGSCSLKVSFSSTAGLHGETSKSSTSGTSLIGNGLKNFGKNKKRDVAGNSAFEFSEDSQDPFAFDEDEFEPSKWEVLSGKKMPSRTKNSALAFGEAEPVSRLQQIRPRETDNGEHAPRESSTCDSHHTEEPSCSGTTDEKYSSLIADCLLSAVKVLMNLTNDNPLGCRQIAKCGGLEIMAFIIARHFPSFSSSSSSLCEIEEYGVKIEFDDPKNKVLSDQELDFLVAILGLLVNLVEKDETNRSRLAKASVSLENSESSDSGGSRDVIPLLCSIFLANRGESETADEEVQHWDAEEMMLQGEKEAEKMIVEAYAALLLAFLSTESKSTRDAISGFLPNCKLAVLVPVLERFVAFHLTLEMMTPETHKAVIEVIESCRIP